MTVRYMLYLYCNASHMYNKKKIYLTVITIQKENISDCHYIQIYHISDCYHNTNIAYTCLYLTFITIQKENISDRHYNTERKYI